MCNAVFASMFYLMGTLFLANFLNTCIILFLMLLCHGFVFYATLIQLVIQIVWNINMLLI